MITKQLLTKSVWYGKIRLKRIINSDEPLPTTEIVINVIFGTPRENEATLTAPNAESKSTKEYHYDFYGDVVTFSGRDGTVTDIVVGFLNEKNDIEGEFVTRDYDDNLIIVGKIYLKQEV